MIKKKKEDISYMEKLREVLSEPINEIEELKRKYLELDKKCDDLGKKYEEQNAELIKHEIESKGYYMITDKTYNLYSKARSDIKKELTDKQNYFNTVYKPLFDIAYDIDNAERINVEILRLHQETNNLITCVATINSHIKCLIDNHQQGCVKILSAEGNKLARTIDSFIYNVKQFIPIVNTEGNKAMLNDEIAKILELNNEDKNIKSIENEIKRIISE